MPRIKEVLAEKNISQNQLAILLKDKYPFMRKAIMSYVTNMQLLPTKELLNAMCSILDCHTNDLYSYEELDYRNCFVENRGVRTPLKLKSTEKVCSENKKIHTISLRIDNETRNFLSNSDVIKNYGVKTFSEFVRLLIKEKIEEVKENG